MYFSAARASLSVIMPILFHLITGRPHLLGTIVKRVDKLNTRPPEQSSSQRRPSWPGPLAWPSRQILRQATLQLSSGFRHFA